MKRARKAKKKLTRRSPAAAVLPKFKAKTIPDRRRQAEEARTRKEARRAGEDDI